MQVKLGNVDKDLSDSEKRRSACFRPWRTTDRARACRQSQRLRRSEASRPCPSQALGQYECAAYAGRSAMPLLRQRLPGGAVRLPSGVPGPPLQTLGLAGDERHEAHLGEFLCRKALLTALATQQLLHAVGRADRHDEHAAEAYLAQQDFGHRFVGSGDDDAVEGRLFRPALDAVADKRGDVGEPERAKARTRRRR